MTRPSADHSQMFAPPKKLSERLKTSLDELRMQVLGAQVLFGFQFRSLFQDTFDHADTAERIADGAALGSLLLVFTLLIVAPAEHRLVEAGEATRRLIALSGRCAEVALAVESFALGCIGFAIGTHMHAPAPWVIGLTAAAIAALGWFGVGLTVRHVPRPDLPEREMTDLHSKIDQMLTESRVILPGVQAMLGFQLIVFMTTAFEKLPREIQILHLVGLGFAVVAVTLLIAPAAVHRLAFQGNDDQRFYKIGTRLLNIALVPLALAIAIESFIATLRLCNDPFTSAAAAAGVLLMMLGAWYVLPLLRR